MLQTRKHGDVQVVLVKESRLDGANSELFKEQLFQFVDQGGDKFVLNLSNVEFIDSKGIGVLVSVHKKLMGSGTCCLCDLKLNVRKIFSTSRIDRLLHIYPTEDEAVAALES
ncbi:MAG: STAS domain-containing protein [Desulfovibrionaceae bacterium]